MAAANVKKPKQVTGQNVVFGSKGAGKTAVALVRTKAGIVSVNGVPSKQLVGKYSVKVQPAPGKPKHATVAEIQQAVAKHMKMVDA